MSDQSAAKPKGGMLRWALWGAALFGVAAVLYIIVQASFKPAQDQPPNAGAASSASAGAKSFAAKLDRSAAGSPPPDYQIYDETGAPLRLADRKGKVVLMNVWATWCGPCKVEMPTLAKLQASYAGKPVEVMAVSIDTTEDAAKAKLFIAGNDPLKFFHDRQAKMPWQLKPAAQGVPTTVIYGRDGLEKARVSGDADWSSPEARAFIDGLVTGS